MTHLLAWTERDVAVSTGGVIKQTIAGAGATLVRVVVPAGTVAGRHHHDHEQFVQILSGSGELETEQGARTFGPGSIFHFPAATWHAARFDTETILVETNLRG